MTAKDAFWDSCALNPLCVREPASASCQSLSAQYKLVVWWATMVEIHSAIARLLRSGSLTAVEEREAINRLTVLQGKWSEILPSEEVRELARSLLRAHPLRAADSLQLAAALIWCRRRPAGRVFISGDFRLCEAAALEGFTVIQLKP